MIAYGIIVGQTMPAIFDSALGESFLSDRHAVIALMTFTVMLPLSCNRDIAALARWSLLALFGVVVIICVTLALGVSVESPPGRGDPYNIAAPGIAQALGIMAFAYVCHHNSFLIYESLQDASPARFRTVTHASVGTAALMSILLAVPGYIAFGFVTQANVLDNFAQDDIAANVARFFFSITIMLTYPIECFVCREVLDAAFFTAPHWQPMSRTRHYITTVGVCICAMGVSLATSNLGIVLELNGIVCANALAFVLPGLCAIKQLPGDSWLSRPKWGAIGLVVFGAALFVVGIITVAIEASEGEERPV